MNDSSFLRRLFAPGLLLALLAGAAPAAGDVVINEFMASNGSTINDEDGDSEDWIELYNTGNQAIDLADWGLSDDLENPFKWRIPAETVIAPGGHLIVFASGKDRIPGSPLPGLLREVYSNISGTAVSDLTNHPSFPNSPSSINRVTDFFEAPTDVADNYGQRMRGILTIPDTGNYRFWIASDDGSELRIGTDPSNLTVIASVPGWTSPRQWNRYASQQSALLYLVAGQQFHVAALMKEGGGGDHLAVRWQRPDGTIEEPIPAHHFISPTTGQLHSNFRISSAGEPLILTRTDGTTADETPPVYLPRDISYGRLTDGAATWHYFAAATPGTANNSPPVTLPPAVTISEPRGFRDAPFSVSLSASEPGATIRYTLDGSTPGLGSPVYSGPLLISATTTLRASATEPGMVQLPPVTATWLFLDDILQQGSATPPGWPGNHAVNNHRMEYGMRQDVVTSDNARLRQGMKSIPSISIVTDLSHLFGINSGIYSYSNISHGWERPVSVELIDPDGNDAAQFQIDAGLRLRGAYSRSTSNPKHSLRLIFRSDYGEKNLDFPLFGDEGVSSFGRLDLRTAQNYSWAFENNDNNTFLREVFSRDTQRDMGMPHTRSRYYHLYLNGQYWGLYMSQERGEADWAASYLGGDSDDWDTIKTSQPGYITEASDGNFAAFNTLHDIAINQGFSGANANNYWRVRGLNPDGTRNPAFPILLDQDNLINYMITAHYVGDRDSPVSLFMFPNRPNNMYALINRENPDGFKWLRHDAEHSLGVRPDEGVTWDPTFIGQNITAQNNFNPATLNWRLLDHPEYRIRMADLMHRHLFGNGALTPQNAKARVGARMTQIDTAIIGESARWGRGRTRDATWIPATNALLGYLDQRRDNIVGYYRNRGWFPSINAPGGKIDESHVSIHAETPFYYMTNGGDPRLPGGGIHPQAVLVHSGGLTPTQMVTRGSVWRYFDQGSEPPVISGKSWTDPDYPAGHWPSGPAVLGFAGATPTNPVATQTKRWVTGTSGPQVNTTYFRHEFTLDEAAVFNGLIMEILRDDGAMVYLNGTEIHRENMPFGTISYHTQAASVTGGSNQTTYFTRTPDAAHLLRPGVNVLAVSVHQNGSTSSDKYFDLSLVGIPAPHTVQLPVHLAAAVRARSYQSGEWSALADFSLLENLPEPSPVHIWDFESTGAFLQPSQTIGGGATLTVANGPATAVLRNTSAQGFETAHLRVNNPLGSTLTWSLPTTGVGALTLSWETRRSGQGAGTQLVEISTGGGTWIPLQAYAVENADPQFKSFDLAAHPGAENNPDFAVRVTFLQGEGGVEGNNRFDNVTLTGIPLPNGNPPASLVFDSSPGGIQSGGALGPVVVRLLDAGGFPVPSFNGPVTIGLLGGGTLGGTLTVNAVNGTAAFGDLSLTGTGAFQLTASAAGLEPASTPVFRSLLLAELIVPQFIQGGRDDLGENLERVPFAWRARIDGLAPNAVYRFGNRVVVAGDAPDNNGAGNMVFVTGPDTAWIRATSSPRFREGDLGTRHHQFTTDADGSFTGWFITEPSGNDRFTPGNTVFFRLLLNDGGGGEETAHILTTSEGAEVIRFGASPGEGSALVGTTTAAARHIAVLHAAADGTGRPLAATPVEITGAETDERYAQFYRSVVATNPSHWGAIIPNTLPGGLRRIEVLPANGTDAAAEVRVAAAGFTGTIDPAGGLIPVLLDAGAGLPVFLPGGTADWHVPANWGTGIVPDAAGATAILNAPATGDRNVNVNAPTTIGSLHANHGDTPHRNRLQTTTTGTLSFDGGDEPALVRIDGGGGGGHLDIDFATGVTLASDLRLRVEQTDGHPLYGALRLQQAWSGPGGLIKQGPGIASLTGAGKSFTGPVVIAQGVLRVTAPAVPQTAAGVNVQPGGQLRLVSAGTADEPRAHQFGGTAVTLAGPGRGGEVPADEAADVLGALRYDPGGSQQTASLTNAVQLAADAGIHVDGSHNTLILDGPLGGEPTATLLKTGGGTLVLAGESPAPAPALEVATGTLAVTGSHPAAVTVATDGVLAGSGTTGPITGDGTVSPGTATLAAPSSAAAAIAAVLTHPGGSTGNGALVLTGADPLPVPPARIDLFIDHPSPQPGDRFAGGLRVPASFDLAAALAATDVRLFVSDPSGPITHHGQTFRQAIPADLLAWSVTTLADGRTLEVLRGGAPTGYAQWRNLVFDDPAVRADDSLAGPDASAAGDATANLLRYALGAGPLDPVAGLLPRLATAADGRWLLRFPYDPAKSDLVWIIRASPDLDDWSEIFFDSRHDAPPATDPAGWADLPVPATRQSLFLRLEIQQE